MTLEELEKLKTDDILYSGNKTLSVVVHPENRDHWKYWEFNSNVRVCSDISIIAYGGKVSDSDLQKLKDWSVVDAEYKLSLDIKTKETELISLKKELEELTRKKMLEQIIPGNVYRVTFVDDMCAVAYVRETCDEKTYFVNIINDNYYSFYTRDIKNAELLQELTEAYENFKTTYESA